MASRSRSYSKCFPYSCNRRITILIGKLIFTSIVFGISIYINWSYIKMLERTKCDCSKGFIRNYIKYIPIVGYIISVIMHIIITRPDEDSLDIISKFKAANIQSNLI